MHLRIKVDRREAGLVIAIVLAAVFNLSSESASLWSGSSATAAEGKDARNATIHPPLTTIVSNSSNPSTRWNSVELLNSLMENSTFSNFSLAELVQRVPKPKGTDVQMYNADAWHRLRAMLGLEVSTTAPEEKSSDRVVLCSIGGSSTAGGGHSTPDKRFDQTFTNMLRATTIPNNIMTTWSHVIQWY